MRDDEVCRLTLTVTGRCVNGSMKWEPEITTTTRAARFRDGNERRDYERWLVVEGRAALTDFEAEMLQCDTERPSEPGPAPLLPPG